MKKYLILPVFVLAFMYTTAYAQPDAMPLPTSSHVAPYKLTVGLNTTTVLIFPAAITGADRGSADILIQKEAGLENVLKLKAAKMNFPPSNIHVYTTDGRLYSFVIDYADGQFPLTYDLAKLESINVKRPALVADAPLTTFEWEELAGTARQAQPFLKKGQKRYGVSLELQTLHLSKGMMLFGFSLTNSSSLPYIPAFLRLYLKDGRSSKRTSVQEQELTPVYVDSLQKLGGKTEVRFVIALPALTISENKKFYIEIGEQNGGRHFSMRLKNRDLLKARKL